MCLLECSLCDLEDDDFEVPAWDGTDDWIDLEDEWELPEWIDML